MRGSIIIHALNLLRRRFRKGQDASFLFLVLLLFFFFPLKYFVLLSACGLPEVAVYFIGVRRMIGIFNRSACYIYNAHEYYSSAEFDLKSTPNTINSWMRKTRDPRKI